MEPAHPELQVDQLLFVEVVEAFLEVHPLVHNASRALALLLEVDLALEAEAQTAHLEQARCLLFSAFLARTLLHHPSQHYYPHVYNLVL